MCEDAASARRPRSVGVSSNIYVFFLPKFKLPISIFYYWHNDKRPKQIAFWFVPSTEVHSQINYVKGTNALLRLHSLCIPRVIICFLQSYVLMALVRRQLTPTCLVESKEWRSTEFSRIGYRCIVAFLKAASWGWGSMLMILPPMHPMQTFQHWNCLLTEILRISHPGLLQIICPSTAKKAKLWSRVSTLMNLLFTLATRLSK